MATLDLSDPEIQKHIKLVQDGSDQNRWAAFGYVPKTNNKIKLYDSGPGGLGELREELGDATIRFAYMRFMINNMKKFLYVAWCGDGVAGPIKGSFSGHAIEFARILKPIHHQLNARNEDDIDEAAILAALNKATGASYDSGAKVQGNTKAFVPTSVAQGREQATKSNAEVKTVINKQDYNKTTESAEFWKSNQAVKEEVKPVRQEYKLTQERDQYWKQQQTQPTTTTTTNSNRPTGPVSRTVANKFQEQTTKPVEKPPVSKPPPSRTGLANKFQQMNVSQPPPPSRPARQEPQYEEPQYEEQQQQYDDQSYQQQDQQYEDQSYQQQDQQYEDQSYQQQEQQYDDQSYQQEEQQQQYDDQSYQQEEQQQYDDQSYQQEEQQQQYDDQQQSTGILVKAVYDYTGENDGDLSFKEGDIINVVDQSDVDGWWQGELNGNVGFFPSTFVTPQ